MRFRLLLTVSVALLLGSCRTHPAAPPDQLILQTLYQQDQADRQATTWSSATDQRDAQRRQTVHELLAAGQVRTGPDHYHAAMVMQHGSDSTDFRLAHQLARRAEALGEPRGRWLAAAALDRYLLSVGQPQRYGTQFREVKGHVYLDRFDSLAVSAAERQRVGAPSLDSLRAYLRTRNHSATASLAPPPPEVAEPLPQVELIGGLDALTRQIQYPAAARAARVEGKVRVQVEVNIDGSVREAFVIDGPGAGLKEEALRVVRQARFINRAGEPWEIRLLVPFKL